MNDPRSPLTRIIALATYKLGLVISATVFSCSAFGAENIVELQESLMKIGESVNNASAIVDRIQASKQETAPHLQNAYSMELRNYKDTAQLAVQSIKKTRENPSTRNLYNLGRDLSELNLRLRSITLWVFLARDDRSADDSIKEIVRPLDNSENDLRTQIFIYDLVVNNILSKEKNGTSNSH